MTFEQLKEEANNLGYKLVKKSTYVPLRKCSCGAKSSVRCYHTFYTKYYQCIKCNLKGEEGGSYRVARENWNKAVEQK